MTPVPQPLPFGLLFTCQDPPQGALIAERWAEILDLAPRAEAAGFDSLHVPEHHLRDDGYLPQPLIACAALAARTTRAKVGPTLCVAPLRHPIHLAEEAAMVDVLSQGRLVLGLGIGNYEPEYDLFDLPMREQARRFDETLDLLRTTWASSPDDAGKPRLTPRPVTSPHPPLWVGAMSEPGAIRAAERGDALLLDPLHTVASLEDLVAIYREHAERKGRTPEVVLMRWGWLEDTPGQALTTWWPHVRRTLWTYIHHIPRFRQQVDPEVSSLQSEEELALSHVVQDRFLVGSAEQVRETLQDWRDRLGLARVVVKFQGETGPWGDPLSDVIDRFGAALVGRV